MSHSPPRALSISRANTIFDRCWRAYFLDQFLPQRDSIYLRRGSAVHNALEALGLLALEEGGDWDAALERMGDDWTKASDEVDLRAVIGQALGFMAQTKPTDIELWFERIYSPDVDAEELPWRGKIDVILEATPLLKDGKIVDEDPSERCLLDYKLVKGPDKILFPAAARRTLQAKAYCLATGIRNFIYLYLPPTGPAVPVSVSLTDEELAAAFVWMRGLTACERAKWNALAEDFGNWQEVFPPAAPGNFLCTEKWCSHWNRCLGNEVDPMATAQDAINLIPGFFKTGDIKDGGPLELTIRDLVIEELRGDGDSKEDKPVLTFQETKKKLVINTTRAQQLGSIFGPNEDLSGKRVLLEYDIIKINSRDMPMICVRAAS